LNILLKNFNFKNKKIKKMQEEEQFLQKRRILDPPPAKKAETLKTRNCFLCDKKCFNGTSVEYEGVKYLVRICNDETCKKILYSKEGMIAIKNKNLLIPSQHKFPSK
jgi:hypothetical protein